MVDYYQFFYELKNKNGLGWESAKKPLRETFNHNNYLFKYPMHYCVGMIYYKPTYANVNSYFISSFPYMLEYNNTYVRVNTYIFI